MRYAVALLLVALAIFQARSDDESEHDDSSFGCEERGPICSENATGVWTYFENECDLLAYGVWKFIGSCYVIPEKIPSVENCTCEPL